MTRNQCDTNCARDHGHLQNHCSEYRTTTHHRERSTPDLSDLRYTSVCESSGEHSNSRMRWIVSLGLLLPALAAIIGVVAWAVSAEVVIGAKRDTALKMLAPVSRFQQHRFESDKFTDSDKSKLNLLQNRLSTGGGSKNQGNKEAKVTKSSLEAPKLNSSNKNSNIYLITGLNSQNSKVKLQTVSNANSVPTKKSAGDKVAEVIDKLVAQRKKQGGSPHIVVVAPMPDKKRNANAKVSAYNLSPVNVTANLTTNGQQATSSSLSKDPEALLAATHLLAKKKIEIAKNEPIGIANHKLYDKKSPYESVNYLEAINLKAGRDSHVEMSRMTPPHLLNAKNIASASHHHPSYLPGNRIAHPLNQIQGGRFHQPVQHQVPLAAQSQAISSFAQPAGLPSRNSRIYKAPQQYRPGGYSNYGNGQANYAPGYNNNNNYQENGPLLNFYASESGGGGSYQDPTPPQGLTLHFGGGPIGGGGQVMTSPLGIFKTLLLPLLPRPRVNLNGKVVFGVVLEKGVGYGRQKQPHYPSYNYYGKRR